MKFGITYIIDNMYTECIFNYHINQTQKYNFKYTEFYIIGSNNYIYYIDFNQIFFQYIYFQYQTRRVKY